MNGDGNWLLNLGKPNDSSAVDGLIPVKGYREELQPERFAVLMKAKDFGAQAVFLEGEDVTVVRPSRKLLSSFRMVHPMTCNSPNCTGDSGVGAVCPSCSARYPVSAALSLRP